MPNLIATLRHGIRPASRDIIVLMTKLAMLMLTGFIINWLLSWMDMEGIIATGLSTYLRYAATALLYLLGLRFSVMLLRAILFCSDLFSVDETTSLPLIRMAQACLCLTAGAATLFVIHPYAGIAVVATSLAVVLLIILTAYPLALSVWVYALMVFTPRFRMGEMVRIYSDDSLTLETGVIGTAVSMGPLHTRLRSDMGIVIVPNRLLARAVIINQDY